MKKYNSSWLAEAMQINFNQKIYRQDFAAFVSKKMYWNITRVSRSKTIENKTSYSSSVKEFVVYNTSGGEVIVRYQNKNEIIYTSHEEILGEYLNLRKIGN